MQKNMYIRYKPKFTGMDVGINSVSSIVLGNVEPTPMVITWVM